MARNFTPQEISALVTEIAKEALGQNNTITNVNSSNFVSVGETIMATGTENVLNSLSTVLGRTFMAVRPRTEKLSILNAMNSGMYTNRFRKISYYAKNPTASGYFNTNEHINLANGLEDVSKHTSVGSQWEQNQAIPLEMNFGGTSVWDDSITIYEDQLKVAFRSPAEFESFISGIMTAKQNDISREKEAFRRMTLLNHMAAVYDFSDKMKGSVINLTKAFNDKYGTNYTSAELRGAHYKEFMMFFTYMFKLTSDYLSDESVNYHWSPTKIVDGETYVLPRETAKKNQKAILYNPLFVEAKATVFPEIFHDNYLDIGNFEGVNFWQNKNDPTAISVTPAVPDEDTGLQKAGAAVNIPFVVGCLFDKDAIMTDFQLENARSTSINARKGYRNAWFHFAKNAVNDLTENFCLFVMIDPEG